MKSVSIFSIFILVLGCQASSLSNTIEERTKVSVEKEDLCCAHRAADGKCVHELIPGCSTGNVDTDGTPSSKSDDCCAHRTATGECSHELVPGCSK